MSKKSVDKKEEVEESSSMPQLELSVPLFFKYLLWVFSMFLCLSGLALGVLAIVAGFFALDFLESAATGPIDSAASSTKLTANSVESFSELGANLTVSTDDISESLVLLATDIKSTSNSLKAISILPGFEGISGMSESTTKLEDAAESVSTLGTQARSDLSSLKSISDDLEELSTSLKKSKRNIQMGFWLAKISLFIAGACIESLLFSTLVLAILQGPPKEKEEKKAD